MGEVKEDMEQVRQKYGLYYWDGDKSLRCNKEGQPVGGPPYTEFTLTKEEVEELEEASVTVGLPAIINFTEKKQLKAIYELRDQSNLVTYTYTLDLNGKRHKVCPSTSVGFGVPYSTEYTNPSRVDNYFGQSGVVILPQADPNGLFSPGSAEATWVLCLNPTTKELAPTYVEPSIEVYLFEMPATD